MPTREEAATGFSRRPSTCQPGSLRLLNYLMSTFGVGNDGCFNPNSYLEPSHTPSWHVYGKAVDAAANWNDPTQRKRGDQVWNWVLANRDALNLQQMIWGNRIWDVSNGAEQVYRHDDHKNHVHIAIGYQASQSWKPSTPTVEDDMFTDEDRKKLNNINDVVGWIWAVLTPVQFAARKAIAPADTVIGQLKNLTGK